jgi:hypothetical protein
MERVRQNEQEGGHWTEQYPKHLSEHRVLEDRNASV